MDTQNITTKRAGEEKIPEDTREIINAFNNAIDALYKLRGMIDDDAPHWGDDIRSWIDELNWWCDEVKEEACKTGETDD